MHKVVKICIENGLVIHTLSNYCDGLELIETDGGGRFCDQLHWRRDFLFFYVIDEAF